jgi:hypothetical protein
MGHLRREQASKHGNGLLHRHFDVPVYRQKP